VSGGPAERTTFGSVLAVAEFRWLWLAGAQSHAGDQLARVALAVLVPATSPCPRPRTAYATNYAAMTPSAGMEARIGIAAYPTDATELNDLFRLADAALYAAKDNGRDHARHASGLTLTG